MPWFRKKKGKIEPVKEKDRVVRTENVFVRCEECGEHLYKRELEENLEVCVHCNYHFRIGAYERLGSRLRVDWQLGTLPATAEIPGLTIQPLLENAIYHGIEPSPQSPAGLDRGHSPAQDRASAHEQAAEKSEV